MNFSSIAIDTVSVCKSGKALKLFVNKKPLEMYSCKLYLPFNPSKFENKWSGNYDYSISCYVTDEFSEFCKNLEKKVTEGLEIFTVNPLVPIMKDNKDFPKLFRLKLPRDSNGNFNFVVYDNVNEKIKVTEDNVDEVFSKKKSIKCMIQCEKLSDWNGSVHISWILTQAKYLKQEEEVSKIIPEKGGDEDGDSSMYTKCAF